MNHRMLEIMKKLRKIQQEFQLLAEEKEIMEDELQKMKATEPDKAGDTRRRTLPKIEKMKPEEKPPAPPERVQTFPSKQKEHLKMKEDLAKAQEAGQAKGQLAEIPPTTPDWEFPYRTIVEDDKDVSKKGKKSTKTKGKGEDVKLASISGTDRPGKAGEILPGKSQDLAETKPKRKASLIQDKEPITPTEKREETKKTKAKTEAVDSKGVAKTKDSGEMKKQRKGS
ncbi:caldesmon [Anolis sagrei]|uniref:caldesmon n=1 Tax=Anolis sagrei TaxID=38937 RepID=UPI003521D6E7